MLQQSSRVLELHPDGVRVCTRAATHCARCAQGRGCGGGLIGALMARGDTSMIAVCDDPARTQVGDAVTVQLPERALLEAAALAYLLPLCTMLLAVALAMIAGVGREGLVALAALGGLLLGGWLARRIVRHVRAQRFCPVAIVQHTSRLQ